LAIEYVLQLELSLIYESLKTLPAINILFLVFKKIISLSEIDDYFLNMFTELLLFEFIKSFMIYDLPFNLL